jgi:hypothetical protein
MSTFCLSNVYAAASSLLFRPSRMLYVAILMVVGFLGRCWAVESDVDVVSFGSSVMYRPCRLLVAALCLGSGVLGCGCGGLGSESKSVADGNIVLESELDWSDAAFGSRRYGVVRCCVLVLVVVGGGGDGVLVKSAGPILIGRLVPGGSFLGCFCSSWVVWYGSSSERFDAWALASCHGGSSSVLVSSSSSSVSWRWNHVMVRGVVLRCCRGSLLW